MSAPSDYGLEVTVEIIDPGMAALYLSNNARHRPIKDKKVAEYMSEMRDGKWRLNGKTVCFDWNGRLLNGQHRLSAVIRSGVPLTTVVVRGLDPDLVPERTNLEQDSGQAPTA